MLNLNPQTTKTPAHSYNPGSRPLRVALLSHSGGLYGAERALLRLAIGLARRPDFRPLVLLPFAGSLYQRCRDYGIEVAVVNYPKWLLGKGSTLKLAGLLLRSLWAWWPLMARLRRFAPDVIYSNTAANPMGALAARRLRIGHVWHLHEFAGEAPTNALGWPLLRRVLSSRRTRLVCNSESTRDHYANVLQRSGIERIYNGLDFAPAPSSNGQQLYDKCVRQTAKIELLLVAGIHDSKGHKDAVRATAELHQQGLPVQLTIAGVGDDQAKAALESLVAEYGLRDAVEFIGFIDNTAPLYKRAALTLVCGRAEGFGRAAVESMAWGTPVIAADAGGLPEIVRNGRTGLLYAPGDAQTLAARITDLINNEEQYASISATGIDWVRQRFPARRYVREMAELLTRAAITRRPHLRGLYRHAITAIPRGSLYGRQV